MYNIQCKQSQVLEYNFSTKYVYKICNRHLLIVYISFFFLKKKNLIIFFTIIYLND